MKRITLVCLLLLVTAGFGHKTLAQDQPSQQPAKAQQVDHSEHFYHLDFVVEDVNTEGKVVNSRSYSTTVSNVPRGDVSGSIRSGSKVPIATGTYSDGKEPSALINTQFQYIDVGADFDVHDVHEVSSQLAFYLVAALSSVASAPDPNLHEPLIRQNKWQAEVLIPIGKQSTVFSSDSVDSKGSTRVLVTATAIQ
jgi:hypothetical protein